MPEDYANQRLPPFQNLIAKYTPPSGKLHIAGLPDDQKERLRRDVHEAIQGSGLPCFWYAIHVAGLNRRHIEEQQFLDDARAAIAASRVKRGSPRADPASMHEALFAGLYAHLIAFLEERGKTDVCIETRSDQIDEPIIRELEGRHSSAQHGGDGKPVDRF